jgi:hypothetical protein
MQGGLEQATQQASSYNAAVSLLLAAATGAIGLLSGWAGAYLKVKGERYATREEFLETLCQVEQNTRTVEEVKAKITTGIAVGKELRDAVRAFTEGVGALTHSMCWLTWDCTERNRLDAEMAKNYDAEVHRVSPQIVGQLALIAMLDKAVVEKLAPLATDVFALDAQVGNAVVLAEKDQATGLAALRQLYGHANHFESRFRERVVDLLKP